MMDRWEFLITNSRRREAHSIAAQAIMMAPEGTLLMLDPPGASRIQQNKFHAMVADIARQCSVNGRRFNERSFKRILVEAFVNIMREHAAGRGERDPFPGSVELVDGVDGEVVALGEQTRRFTRAQAVEFVEYLLAFGAQQTPQVAWSEPAQKVIRELLNRKAADQ
jgi:hypothetical protein